MNTKCILWDKVSDIKGFDKDYWLEKYPFFNDEDVMIEEVSGVVMGLRTVNSVRTQLKVESDLTSQEVIEIYAYNANNNLEQEPEQVRKWKESEAELSQAKLLLMKEGII